jgi:hypothetical protein
VVDWLANQIIGRSSLEMLRDDDSLGAIPAHSLKIPDWVVVHRWAEHMAPTASYAWQPDSDRFPSLSVWLEIGPHPVAVPRDYAQVCPVTARVIVCMIEVHDIVQLVGGTRREL